MRAHIAHDGLMPTSRSAIPLLIQALRDDTLAASEGASPFARALIDGVRAVSVGQAFQGGYRAALQALVPSERTALIALCVTEEKGQHPKHIETSLSFAGDELHLHGAKKWAMDGEGTLLIVAKEEGSSESRPTLRLVRVPTSATGLERIAMPPTRFIPDVPHTRLALDVTLPKSALLPGDGYSDYVKPFRTLEDIHVHASVMAYLLKQAKSTVFARSLIEPGTSLLLSLEAHAHMPSPALDVALTGTLALVHRFFGEADSALFQKDDEASIGWQRDKAILLLGAAAREARANNAWGLAALK